jgi:hypothetical protein
VEGAHPLNRLDSNDFLFGGDGIAADCLERFPANITCWCLWEYSWPITLDILRYLENATHLLGLAYKQVLP